MEPDVNTNILGILHLKNAQEIQQKRKKNNKKYTQITEEIPKPPPFSSVEKNNHNTLLDHENQVKKSKLLNGTQQSIQTETMWVHCVL